MKGPNFSGDVTDDYGATDKGSVPVGKTAQDRRDELTHADVMSQNVQMRHVPTGEVTTFNRKALESERLYVPALREEFPRDQFEEFKERAT